MLIINRASASGVAYWDRSALRSAWLGRGAEPLGLSGEVAREDLRHVLLGLKPGTGEVLAARARLRRRHGWDLIFAAPKSVSLLAVAEPAASGPIGLAFEGAVADAVQLLEERAAWARRGGGLEPVAGVVAAAFLHLHNDAGQPHLHSHVVLANAAKLRGTEGWQCLVADELWQWRDGLGPAFQLGLRAKIRAAGLDFDWELTPGGLGEIRQVPSAWRGANSSRSLASRASALQFGSPTAGAAKAARARTRSPAATVRLGKAAAETGLFVAELAEVITRARTAKVLPSPPPSAEAVERALARRASAFNEPMVLAALGETLPAGMGVAEAAAWARQFCEARTPLAPPRRQAPRAPAQTDERGVAVSAKPGEPQEGVSPQGNAVRRTPVPARARWTTRHALELDDEVLRAAAAGQGARLAAVSPVVATALLRELGFAGQAAEAGLLLACSGDGISFLPPGPWLAQAACIDAARAIWQAAGYTVFLQAPGELSSRRWRALTSLRQKGEGLPAGSYWRWGSQLYGPSQCGRRVVVVDAADYIGPADLCRLVRMAQASLTKLVLVAGGTAPPRREALSRSVDHLAERALLAGKLNSPNAGPHPPGFPCRPEMVLGSAHEGVGVPGLAVSGAFSGQDAMANVVKAWLRGAQDWLRLGAASPGRAYDIPLMVAFGREEVEALNLAARRLWLSLLGSGAGRLRGSYAGSSLATSPGPLFCGSPAQVPHAGAQPTGPEIVIGRRAYAVGDEVMALRRVGNVPSATRGTVAGLDQARGAVVVDWRVSSAAYCRQLLSTKNAEDFGYGYATTPPYLRTLRGPRGQGRTSPPGAQTPSTLVVLGDPLQLGPLAPLARSAWVTLSLDGGPAFGPAGEAARRRSGIAELAVSWPDKELLELAGTRPLHPVKYQLWARHVADHALRRTVGYEVARMPGRAIARGLSLQVPGQQGRAIATEVGEGLPMHRRRAIATEVGHGCPPSLGHCLP